MNSFVHSVRAAQPFVNRARDEIRLNFRNVKRLRADALSAVHNQERSSVAAVAALAAAAFNPDGNEVDCGASAPVARRHGNSSSSVWIYVREDCGRPFEEEGQGERVGKEMFAV